MSHTDILIDKAPYNYTLVLSIEEPFYSPEYVHSLREWVKINLNYFYAMAIAYVVLVLVGQKFMKSKQKLELRLPLIAWNILLATFSIIGAARCLPGWFT
jgi:elongation of very long chain fatty acids protein 6